MTTPGGSDNSAADVVNNEWDSIQLSSDSPILPIDSTTDPGPATDLGKELSDSWRMHALEPAYKSDTPESDRMSLFSTPHFTISSIDEEVKITTDLARSFFLSGELGNAELFFTKSMALMRKL